MTGERQRVRAVGGEWQVPDADPIARDYILLALRLDQHEPGIVDGYFGPRALKGVAETTQLPAPARLAEDARELRGRVGQQADGARARWLDRQLLALETIASTLAGASLPYAEEVERCFDARPEPTPPAWYADARAALDAVLPGGGNVQGRLEAWDARWVIPVERLAPLIPTLLDRLREASEATFPTPAGESVSVNLVQGQPWSGYNWYDGGLRSRVDINTDLPVRVGSLIATLSHETFPGHHLEHAWKEQRLVQEEALLEASILLIDTPECYVSEGLAELGRRFTLPKDRWLGLFLEVAEAAGLEATPDDAERQWSIGRALQLLRGSGGDAALLLHGEGRSEDEVVAFLVEEALSTPERARKTIDFITHRLWRTYVFSYAGGERLLERWCDAAGSAQGASDRFFRLLTEQLTPSGITAEIATG
jgi:hypothetical protein